MRYLLDTDHLSILNSSTGQDYAHLSARMATISIFEFGITIVTIHEQFLGSHAYINRARNSDQLVRGYEFMTKLVRDVKIIPVVEFDEEASAIFDNLQHQRIKLVTMVMPNCFDCACAWIGAVDTQSSRFYKGTGIID